MMKNTTNNLLKLDWDSSFFDRPIYKLSYEENSNLDLFNNFDFEKNALIYLFSNIPVETEGFQHECDLMDVKVTYQKNTTTFQSHSPIEQKEIQEFVGKTANKDLINLAYISGRDSRFKLDPHLKHKFKELYDMWLQKSIAGQLADKVFVYKETNNDKYDGFVTIKQVSENKANIGLIAVSEMSRGKRIGSLLIQKCVDWCRHQSIETLTVPTQERNKGACLFYKKNGFDLISKEYIYHIYLDS